MTRCFLLLFIIVGLTQACSEGPSIPEDEGLVSLSAGPLTIAIDPAVGARIASFTYEGREMLQTERDANDWQWGSTLWSAPQSDWGWPPPSFDTVAFTYDTTASNRFHFYGPVDRNSGLQLIKSVRLAVDQQYGPVATLKYHFYNRGLDTLRLGVWENTRVPYAGRVILPGGEFRLSQPETLLVADTTGGRTTVVLDDAQPAKQKLFLRPAEDTKYLFAAYEREGLTLLKRWKRPPGVTPEQAPVELFISPEEGFAELEAQGSYRIIPPGERVGLTVLWQLFPAEKLDRELAALR